MISAPVDRDFRSWASDHVGEEAADQLARSAGILTYHHDPGELSAAFVWEPLVRGLLSAPPAARYPREFVIVRRDRQARAGSSALMRCSNSAGGSGSGSVW